MIDYHQGPDCGLEPIEEKIPGGGYSYVYYINLKLHSRTKPNIIKRNTSLTQEWWCRNGVRHNLEAPALLWWQEEEFPVPGIDFTMKEGICEKYFYYMGWLHNSCGYSEWYKGVKWKTTNFNKMSERIVRAWHLYGINLTDTYDEVL